MTGTTELDPDWFRERARAHRSAHDEDCLGTVSLIDAEARRRGAAAVRTGQAISLSRPITAEAAARADDRRPTAQIEVFVETAGDRTVGTDRVTLDAHGTPNTHLDGLTHFGIDGEWHGGRPCASPSEEDRSLVAWARHGLVTRAVLADIPAHRGTEWVEVGAPVTADDIQASLDMADVEVVPGDALLLYMGRDRFERAGNELLPIARAEHGRPGVGRSAAEWIADNGVSLLCWDFLDAHGPGIEPLVVHHLIWAIGLALVDCCELGAAADALRGRRPPTGLLSVAPLALEQATGCMVNPLLVT
ncbi:MAG TPA: cyclase family protein [Acidimicrobiales bacterium]|nr:cyclase family protein [Acidimicrobiales bacterium]